MTAPEVVAICAACDGVVLDHDLHYAGWDGTDTYHEHCCPACNHEGAGAPASRLSAEVSDCGQVYAVLAGAVAFLALFVPTIVRVFA